MTDLQLLKNSPAPKVTRKRNGEASSALHCFYVYDLSDLFCCMQHTALHFSDLETTTRYTAYETGGESPSATHIDMMSCRALTQVASPHVLSLSSYQFFPPYTEGNNGAWRTSETMGDGPSGALFMQGRNENMYKIVT